MQTKIIKEKIKSVGNIKKITKTMEMVSAAKMKKAIDSALLLRPFREEAEKVLSDISQDSLSRHELIMDNGSPYELMIILASNKGLCGSYNINIYRKFISLYDEEKRKHLKVIVIGKYGEKIAKKLHLEVLASFNHKVTTSVDAHAITTMIVNWYKEKTIGKVSMLYTYFASSMLFTPHAVQLLPFKTISKDLVPHPKELRYTYEPDESSVLSAIIPIMLHNIIHGAILESYASEHSARMFAMKSATDNAKEIQDELKLFYNRARQSAVTREIAEITSGAMALQH